MGYDKFNKEGLEIPLMHDLSMTCLYDMARKGIKEPKKKLIDADINHLEGSEEKNHDEDLNIIKDSHEMLP